MFNGWSYPLTNIPAGWNSNGKWKLTYSSCQKLLGKDRIYEISDPTVMVRYYRYQCIIDCLFMEDIETVVESHKKLFDE